MSAASVTASTAPDQGAGPGSIPRAALQLPIKSLRVFPIAKGAAKRLSEQRHYLRSYPAAGLLDFGVYVEKRLSGVVVIGSGPPNVHRLFDRAANSEVSCLSRLWLDDRLGKNSESRTLGVILRLLRRHQTTIKAIVAYSDPGVGHTGGIYRASGWSYLGLSDATPLYRMPDGSLHHSRSLAQRFGTHSLAYFRSKGIEVVREEQQPKHTYVAFVDRTWRERLRIPVLPYPKEREAP